MTFLCIVRPQSSVPLLEPKEARWLGPPPPSHYFEAKCEGFKDIEKKDTSTSRKTKPVDEGVEHSIAEGLMRLIKGELVGPFYIGNPGEFRMRLTDGELAQDERELKRQRRKQSNRESAHRSRFLQSTTKKLVMLLMLGQFDCLGPDSCRH